METEEQVQTRIEDILEDRQRTTGRPKIRLRKLSEHQKQFSSNILILVPLIYFY